VKLVHTCFLLILVIAFLPFSARADSSVATPQRSTVLDPVRSDPAPTLQAPASMEELGILSHGARIDGLMYLAAGAGPHPIVIFLHGYPGFGSATSDAYWV
jgi:dipeptidyl aminopeptidase/acylaminoacyl peptidase